MSSYKDFFECRIIDGDTPNAKQLQINQIKPFDFSQAQLENSILNRYIETLENQIYEKIGINCDAMILKDALRKAKIYDSLSNELGCPLEIVSKIMLAKIDEIIVNYGDGGYGSPYTEYITASISNIYHDTRKGIVIETNICEIPLKDYGVNWWLVSDKESE